MRLALNLASPAARRRRLLRRGLVAGVCLLLLATAGHALLLHRGRGHLAALEEARKTRAADLEQVRARSAAPGRPGERSASLAQRVHFYNALLEASAFSWTGLLNELETALPEGVGVAEIRPDQSLAGVHLRGQARTLQALTGFVRRLEERPLFTGVFLLRHGARKDPRSGREILEFDIRLDLKREST